MVMHIHIIMSVPKIYSVVKGLCNVINNETLAVARAPRSILHHTRGVGSLLFHVSDTGLDH